jgi:hypothetical protein
MTVLQNLFQGDKGEIYQSVGNTGDTFGPEERANEGRIPLKFQQLCINAIMQGLSIREWTLCCPGIFDELGSHSAFRLEEGEHECDAYTATI